MKLKNRVMMASTAICLSAAVAVTSIAATEHWNDNSSKTALSDEWAQYKAEWETIKTDYENVSLTPGADETKMNYAWYSKNADEAKVRISKSADMTKTMENENQENVYAEDVKEYTGTSKAYKEIDGVSYYANKVTVDDLEENTTYYYQCLVDGKWTKTENFKTGDSSSFTFMYVGDPQIGASKGQVPKGSGESGEKQSAEIAARNDAFSWNKTLKSAMNDHPNIDFIVSAGDQINNTGDDNGQECEYAGFLSADVLANVPIAATIGNHDSKFANYQNHFNVPNPYTEEQNATPAGNDYYYSYGDALFIVLNTNNYNVADHENLIKKAVASHKDAKWKIVTFHQDIYGSGYDHSDSDGIVLRTALTSLLDKYDIDVVLQGHDHTYSRSYMLTSDGQQHTQYTADNIKSEYTNIKDYEAAKGDGSQDAETLASKKEFLDQNLCYKIVDRTQGSINNPEGVLYMEANSATGSKYYNLISTQQDYIAARNQTWTPTYSVVNVTDDSFTIDTYDVNTGKKIDETFSITKKEEAAATPTATPAQTAAPAPTTAPTQTAAPTQTTAPAPTTTPSVTAKKTTAAVKVKSITLNKKKVTLKKGKTFTLKATVKPANAATTKVTFRTSNKKVAAVNAKGKIKAKKKGSAIITVKAGSKKAACKVKVK